VGALRLSTLSLAVQGVEFARGNLGVCIATPEPWPPAACARELGPLTTSRELIRWAAGRAGRGDRVLRSWGYFDDGWAEAEVLYVDH